MFEPKKRLTFVVDTDAYAGNLERPMALYICGRADDYVQDYLSPYRDLFNQEVGASTFENLIEWRLVDPGDDGFHRAPMDIYPTPGTKWEYNSVGIFLSREPTAEELKLLTTRAKNFSALPPITKWSNHRPKILGCRLLLEETVLKSRDVG